MLYYSLIAAVVGIVLGIMIAKRAKKAEGITYGKLDMAGKVVNIVMTVVYAIVTPFFMVIAGLSVPNYDSSLGFFGWVAATIVAIIIGSAPMLCALGIGTSVALRKQGKSKWSFAVQFAGVCAIALALLLFYAFYGTLLETLN